MSPARHQPHTTLILSSDQGLADLPAATQAGDDDAGATRDTYRRLRATPERELTRAARRTPHSCPRCSGSRVGSPLSRIQVGLIPGMTSPDPANSCRRLPRADRDTRRMGLPLGIQDYEGGKRGNHVLRSSSNRSTGTRPGGLLGSDRSKLASCALPVMLEKQRHAPNNSSVRPALSAGISCKMGSSIPVMWIQKKRKPSPQFTDVINVATSDCSVHKTQHAELFRPRVSTAEPHVNSHLLVRDVSSGHERVLVAKSCPHTPRPTGGGYELAPPVGSGATVGLRPPFRPAIYSCRHRPSALSLHRPS